MNGLSLFANVGIAETYLKDVGIDIVVANELLAERCRFYSHLYPECDMIQGSICDTKISDEIIKKAKSANVDFVIATPPCQGMSIAGEMNPYDERNSLIKYAIDVIEQVKPKFIMFENVVQMLETPIQFNDREVLIPEYIKLRLGKLYKINDRDLIINAADYGVPQTRKRCIILLVRKDINCEWVYPTPEKEIITLDKAFKGIPDLWPLIKEKEYQNFFPENSSEALSFHKWHKPTTHVWRNVECMLYTSTGNTAFDNPVHYPKKLDGKKISGYDTTYHRLFWNKPCSTITRYNGIIGSQNNVHPGKPWKRDDNGEMMYTNPRVLTIYELLIVSSLPTDWNIPDWASNGLIRHVIGEGIPPLLVKKIVEMIPKNYRGDN